MAGHSHWANIKHKKGANDARKAKVITQMGKLIKVAVQLGGPDVDSNPRLRLALSKARAQNMNRDVIERIIKRASGEAADGKRMEELVYEGYATQGVAVVVEAMTDNRNRTAPEVRKLFERAGGSLGAPGCVAWQFRPKAIFLVSGGDEEQALECILEAEADVDDITCGDEDGTVAITADPEHYDRIADALQAANLTILSSDITKVPDNDVIIDDPETGQRIQKLIDALEDHDDVSAVFTNFCPTPAVAETLAAS